MTDDTDNIRIMAIEDGLPIIMKPWADGMLVFKIVGMQPNGEPMCVPFVRRVFTANGGCPAGLFEACLN